MKSLFRKALLGLLLVDSAPANSATVAILPSANADGWASEVLAGSSSKLGWLDVVPLAPHRLSVLLSADPAKPGSFVDAVFGLLRPDLVIVPQKDGRREIRTAKDGVIAIAERGPLDKAVARALGYQAIVVKVSEGEVEISGLPEVFKAGRQGIVLGSSASGVKIDARAHRPAALVEVLRIKNGTASARLTTLGSATPIGVGDKLLFAVEP